MNAFDDALNRIMMLERRVGELATVSETLTATIQTVSDTANAQSTATIHLNLVRNGEFDISRNAYLYPIDVTGTG